LDSLRLKGQAAAITIMAMTATLMSCRQDMHDQPKFKGYRGTSFFADRRSARPVVEDTVARGQLREDEKFTTGKVDGKPVVVLPVPLTRQLLDRGRERYDIFCAPCHDRTGAGLGMVVRRGLRRPNSFHIDRLRESPVGTFYDVMSNGFGAMSDYASQIEPADRWAIAAYIRALQLSQRAALADVPEEERAKLAAAPAPTPGQELLPLSQDWTRKGDEKPPGAKAEEKH
jgi:mono/diheme cytochrome c family protein